jgi:translation initiation factor IF-3
LKPTVPNRDKKPFRYFANHQIRAESIRLIDNDGQNLGVIPLREALEKARALSLDLVQIAIARDEPPTCKIVNYSKFKYDLSKKYKELRKKQRENEVRVKELKFRPGTDDNDLLTKAKQAATFLDDNCRLKITIVFRGRELAHQNIARETLNKFVTMVPGLVLDGAPSLTGKYLSVMGFKK